MLKTIYDYDGRTAKTDVESPARKLIPMFNFDGLVQSKNSVILNLNGGWIQGQFSNNWG